MGSLILGLGVLMLLTTPSRYEVACFVSGVLPLPSGPEKRRKTPSVHSLRLSTLLPDSGAASEQRQNRLRAPPRRRKTTGKGLPSPFLPLPSASPSPVNSVATVQTICEKAKRLGGDEDVMALEEEMKKNHWGDLAEEGVLDAVFSRLHSRRHFTASVALWKVVRSRVWDALHHNTSEGIPLFSERSLELVLYAMTKRVGVRESSSPPSLLMGVQIEDKEGEVWGEIPSKREEGGLPLRSWSDMAVDVWTIGVAYFDFLHAKEHPSRVAVYRLPRRLIVKLIGYRRRVRKLFGHRASNAMWIEINSGARLNASNRTPSSAGGEGVQGPRAGDEENGQSEANGDGAMNFGTISVVGSEEARSRALRLIQKIMTEEGEDLNWFPKVNSQSLPHAQQTHTLSNGPFSLEHPAGVQIESPSVEKGSRGKSDSLSEQPERDKTLAGASPSPSHSETSQKGSETVGEGKGERNARPVGYSFSSLFPSPEAAARICEVFAFSDPFPGRARLVKDLWKLVSPRLRPFLSLPSWTVVDFENAIECLSAAQRSRKAQLGVVEVFKRAREHTRIGYVPNNEERDEHDFLPFRKPSHASYKAALFAHVMLTPRNASSEDVSRRVNEFMDLYAEMVGIPLDDASFWESSLRFAISLSEGPETPLETGRHISWFVEGMIAMMGVSVGLYPSASVLISLTRMHCKVVKSPLCSAEVVWAAYIELKEMERRGKAFLPPFLYPKTIATIALGGGLVGGVNAGRLLSVVSDFIKVRRTAEGFGVRVPLFRMIVKGLERARGGAMGEAALRLFRVMKERGGEVIDVEALNAVLECIRKTEDLEGDGRLVDAAFAEVEDMRSRGVLLNAQTYVHLVAICARANSPRWRRAQSLLTYMEKKAELRGNEFAYAHTIHALASADGGPLWEEALDVFKQSRRKGVLFSSSAVPVALMAALENAPGGARWGIAKQVFVDCIRVEGDVNVKEERYRRTRHTLHLFKALLAVLVKSQQQETEGRRSSSLSPSSSRSSSPSAPLNWKEEVWWILENMEKFGIEPDAEFFTLVMRVIERRAQRDSSAWEEGLLLFDEIKKRTAVEKAGRRERQIAGSGEFHRTLISTLCKSAGGPRWMEALLILQEMHELRIPISRQTFHLVLEGLATAEGGGRLPEALQVFEMMKEEMGKRAAREAQGHMLPEEGMWVQKSEGRHEGGEEEYRRQQKNLRSFLDDEEERHRRNAMSAWVSQLLFARERRREAKARASRSLGVRRLLVADVDREEVIMSNDYLQREREREKLGREEKGNDEESGEMEKTSFRSRDDGLFVGGDRAPPWVVSDECLDDEDEDLFEGDERVQSEIEDDLFETGEEDCVGLHYCPSVSWLKEENQTKSVEREMYWESESELINSFPLLFSFEEEPEIPPFGEVSGRGKEKIGREEEEQRERVLSVLEKKGETQSEGERRDVSSEEEFDAACDSDLVTGDSVAVLLLLKCVRNRIPYIRLKRKTDEENGETEGNEEEEVEGIVGVAADLVRKWERAARRLVQRTVNERKGAQESQGGERGRIEMRRRQNLERRLERERQKVRAELMKLLREVKVLESTSNTSSSRSSSSSSSGWIVSPD
uniref:Pentacotripeptide-repeat region of PRORP domain-containing protein n=1 Tax=Chromera velia CCMP2878 TaxID=1169474 RepID=A0A0G4I294_9ALVE|eukprot:Cvel_10276.t1-p1 / transcript=Cvel_10276.t1 / gene=Cvel_10276 / organism=Chromera_velia_CCMP2878 / gene_product=hypothetical protein / transcript_product=hypothetical protein / location=Cvel_scaffold616:61984-69258(-) / protein_length=1595 / sequence_SO=supercontig / SO=protein_coding / is_pseudo=false